MSRRCYGTFAVLVALASLALPADQPAKGPAAAEMVARFHDGTTIRKALLQESVQITTRYGKLTVPVGDIRRIEFGLHVAPDIAQKIDDAVRNLGDVKFSLREAAGKELLALGFRAYGPLQLAAKSTDKEVAARAAALLASIRAAVPAELLQLKSHDVIHTRDCVLAGHIDSPTLKAKTANFGELHFKIGDLYSLQSMTRTETQVAVEAGAAGSVKWIDTGVVIENGLDLVIRASGQIDFTNAAGQVPPGPAGPILGAFVSGPDGCPNAPGSGAYAVGTLLGKIGERGPVFMVGQRFDGKALGEGRLHLLVMPWPGSATGTGSYKVTIATGFELVPGAGRIEPASAAPGNPSSFNPGKNFFGTKKKKGEAARSRSATPRALHAAGSLGRAWLGKLPAEPTRQIG